LHDEVREMKAAFLKGPKKLIVKDTDDPKPKPGYVILKVKYCGICGSDLHGYETGVMSGILGHEFSGEIESVGESVKGWEVGNRVTANPNTGCGVCYYCRRGETNQCMKFTAVGIMNAPGAYAERVAVRADTLIKLGEATSFEAGALVEPLAPLVRATKYAVKLADTVAIIGAGTIGLLALQCARLAGARAIYVTEPSKSRADAAKKLGADHVFNPKEVRAGEETVKLTKGLGVDVAFECVGKPETIQEAERIARKGGKVMIIGECLSDVPTNYAGIFIRELDIKGIYDGSIQDFDDAAHLIESGKIDVDTMVTDKIGLSEIVEKGFEALLKPEKNSIKILVDPQR
jgi:(R,R)-butanediol dehydrogenase/meso-butanediol dehydrogenase/diacetyl reductase